MRWALFPEKITFVMVLQIFLLVSACSLAYVFVEPLLIGAVEASTNRNFIKWGPCRIENTNAVLVKGKSATIVSGYLLVEDKERPHQWGVRTNGEIIDVSYTGPATYRPTQTINPWETIMPVLANNPKNIMDRVQNSWTRRYLFAFIAYKRVSGNLNI